MSLHYIKYKSGQDLSFVKSYSLRSWLVAYLYKAYKMHAIPDYSQFELNGSTNKKGYFNEIAF